MMEYWDAFVAEAGVENLRGLSPQETCRRFYWWLTKKHEAFALRNTLQKCRSGHQYLASSHEYPCPVCQAADAVKALKVCREVASDVQRWIRTKQFDVQACYNALAVIMRYTGEVLEPIKEVKSAAPEEAKPGA